MSGLDQLFGGLPHDPPPFFTRPVTIEGVRETTYTPVKAEKREVTHPMPAPWQGYIISQGSLGKRNVYRPTPEMVLDARARAASASAARRVQQKANFHRSIAQQRGGPTARPKALGQVRANQPHAQGPLPIDPANAARPMSSSSRASNQPHAQGPLPIDPANAARPMSSSSRASNASNISAQAKAAQDTLMILTPRMKADPEVRAALRKIKARAKALEG